MIGVLTLAAFSAASALLSISRSLLSWRIASSSRSVVSNLVLLSTLESSISATINWASFVWRRETRVKHFNTFQQLSKEAKMLISPRQSYTSQLGLLNIPPSPAASAGSSSAGRRGKVCQGGTWLGTAAAETWGSAVSGAAPATVRAEYNTRDVMPKE